MIQDIIQGQLLFNLTGFAFKHEIALINPCYVLKYSKVKTYDR